MGSAVAALEHRDGLSCSEARGNLPRPGVELCPLHWQGGFLDTDHQGNPRLHILISICSLGCVSMETETLDNPGVTESQEFPRVFVPGRRRASPTEKL